MRPHGRLVFLGSAITGLQRNYNTRPMCCRKLLPRELEGALNIVVGSDQKPDLNGGDYDQSRSAQRQPKCVYGIRSSALALGSNNTCCSSCRCGGISHFPRLGQERCSGGCQVSSHRIGSNEHGRGRIFAVGNALTRGGERDRDLVTVNLEPVPRHEYASQSDGNHKRTTRVRALRFAARALRVETARSPR